MSLYYHGTKYDVDEVMNNPMMKPAFNGVGLYLTKDINVARCYGKVICFEVEDSFEVDVIRPIDGVLDAPYEYVITTQGTYVSFMKSLLDVTLH